MKKKIVFWLIFVLVAAHFLKDITQDILKIPTFLDLMGDVNEDLSVLPGFLRQGFLILGYSSFLAELFLLAAIPFIILKKSSVRLEKIVWGCVIFLILYLLSATLLDPRFWPF